MKRYNVPRIAFVNKCDRQGANPFKVCAQLADKLKLNSCMTQVPIGLSDEHEGVVNLVNMKSYIFSGDNGEIVTEGEIPEDLMDTVLERRGMMLMQLVTGLDNLEGQEDFA